MMTIEFSYLDTLLLGTLPLLITELPKPILHTITGNLLGDGYLQVRSYTKEGIRTGDATFNIHLDVKSKPYLEHLHSEIYTSFDPGRIRPQKSPNDPLAIKSYQFSTHVSPILTEFHSLWYKWDPKAIYHGKLHPRFVKTIPLNISDMFSERSLAYWIMDDGYIYKNAIHLCTDSFTYEECVRLCDLLSNYGIKSGILTRTEGTYRIRTSTRSRSLIRDLVISYMHPIFSYKLGDKN